jgi:hypothetical protein
MKLLVLALAFAIPDSFAADTAADLQKKFVGSWRLVSIEGLNQIVKSKPSGIIMYDNTGHMSVQITVGDKPVFPAWAQRQPITRRPRHSTITSLTTEHTPLNPRTAS